MVIVNAGRLAAQGTLAELAAEGAAVSVRTPQVGQLITALARAGGCAERIRPDGLRFSGPSRSPPPDAAHRPQRHHLMTRLHRPAGA